MRFESMKDIKAEGFTGFEKIGALMSNECVNVPNVKGIYLVLINEKPNFLEKNTGGHFKRKNPTVPISILESNWVDNAIVIYIGKAGGGTSKATLKSRLKQYMKFGSGQPVGHWGGRLIWQLSDNKEFTICWKATPNDNPRELEKDLIAEFENNYSKKPFANLQG
ncbi:MAG: hypothetical protein AB7W47_03975 [Calditrichaceae bacterium]